VSIVDRILRIGEGRTLKKLDAIADQVEALADEYSELSDAELREMTDDLKERYQDGETLDDLLPEAFATVVEAADRVLGMRPYHVQIMGGAALHRGNIAEMKTGEGKTLVATMPSYLRALTGKGVHVVTVNDYLAEYQSDLMGRVHRFLGLTTGCIPAGQTPAAPGGGSQAQAGRLLGAQVQRWKGVVSLVDPVAGLLGASGGGHLDAELAQRVLVPLELATSRDRVGGGVRQGVSRHAGHELLGTETGGAVAQGEEKAHQALLSATDLLAHGPPA